MIKSIAIMTKRVCLKPVRSAIKPQKGAPNIAEIVIEIAQVAR